MHELTVTQNLLDIALTKAQSKRIVNVNLLIGPFSEDREESIRFYWRDLAKGTPGEGAHLHFHHMESNLKCLACGGTLIFEDGESICAYCCSDHMRSFNGEEVKLESLDVE